MILQCAEKTPASDAISDDATAAWTRSVRHAIKTVERLSSIQVKTAEEKAQLARTKHELDLLIREKGAQRDKELAAAYESLVVAVSRAIRPFVATDEEAQSMGKLPSLATSVFSRIGRYSVGRDLVVRAKTLIEELKEPVPSLKGRL